MTIGMFFCVFYGFFRTFFLKYLSLFTTETDFVNSEKQAGTAVFRMISENFGKLVLSIQKKTKIC